jgi:RimJ/RimL family protein N-acetyltransferase
MTVILNSIFFYRHKNDIAFRKVDRVDLPDLMELKNESWFGTVQTACLNLTDQEKWFEKMSGDKSCLYFIAIDVKKGDAIGLFAITGIDPINQSCDFSHSIYSSYRGKGLGKMSLRAGIDMTFEVFNMRRIETWILDNNKAEAKSVQKIGFVEEGCKRQAVYKCGEYLDCRLYGLLRSEWDTSAEVAKFRAHTYQNYALNTPVETVGVCNLSYRPKNFNDGQIKPRS